MGSGVGGAPWTEFLPPARQDFIVWPWLQSILRWSLRPKTFILKYLGPCAHRCGVSEEGKLLQHCSIVMLCWMCVKGERKCFCVFKTDWDVVELEEWILAMRILFSVRCGCEVGFKFHVNICMAISRWWDGTEWVPTFMSIFVWRFRDGGMVQNGSRLFSNAGKVAGCV
jgi:hypothetical protein